MGFYYLAFFFFKQKTAYEMRISDWSSDVCSSDLCGRSNRRKTAYQPNPSPRTKSNVPQAQALVEGWMPEPVRHDGSHHTFFSAASKSAIRSSASSTPIEMRTRLSVMPSACLRLSDTDRCVIAAGWLRSEEHTSELQSLMRTPYA